MSGNMIHVLVPTDTGVNTPASNMPSILMGMQWYYCGSYTQTKIEDHLKYIIIDQKNVGPRRGCSLACTP